MMRINYPDLEYEYFNWVGDDCDLSLNGDNEKSESHGFVCAQYNEHNFPQVQSTK